MIDLLKQQGWICQKCNCPGGNGFDCASTHFRNVVIKTEGTRFRIYRNSFLIEAGHGYQLEDKLKTNQLYYNGNA